MPVKRAFTYLIVLCCLLAGVCAAEADRPDTAAVAEVQGESAPGIFPLLARESAALSLVVSRMGGLAETTYCLKYALPNDGAFYSVTDITLNGRIRLPDVELADGDGLLPLEIWDLYARDLLPAGEPLDFSCRMRKETYGEGKPWVEVCEALIPADFQPQPVFLPCLGAAARRQALLEDSRIRVTLIGLGEAPDSAGKLSFLLRVENHSDGIIPLKVSGLVVNGAYFAAGDGFSFQTHLYRLAPGAVCHPSGSLSLSSLLSSGITGISDVSLLLLTDAVENSGVSSATGGASFPVQLSESAPAEEEPEGGLLLFENEWIQMYYVDCGKPNEWIDRTTYTWRLLVRNISDRNIELETPDERLQGEVTCSFVYSQIGAGCWKYVTVIGEAPSALEHPAFSLWVRGCSAGGGRLLFPEAGPFELPLDS